MTRKSVADHEDRLFLGPGVDPGSAVTGAIGGAALALGGGPAVLGGSPAGIEGGGGGAMSSSSRGSSGMLSMRASASPTGSSSASTVRPMRSISAGLHATSRSLGSAASPSHVPFFAPRSRTRTSAPRRTTCACSREASPSAMGRSHSAPRPSVYVRPSSASARVRP